MRYINSPNKEAGANMIVLQSKGHMMYRTLRHIPLCTELLVWYGDNYGQYLDDLREEREAYYDEEEEDIEIDSEDEATEDETEYDEEDDLSEVCDNEGDEEAEEEEEIDSEDDSTEDETEYDDEDNLSEVGDEETNSNDSDSNDIDKYNSNENKSEKLFLNNIDEIVETKIYDQHKDIKINCSAKKTDDEECMTPESNMYANENVEEDL